MSALFCFYEGLIKESLSENREIAIFILLQTTNYKLGLTWKTCWIVANCAAILHNIIWPRLGRQFHFGSRFTCLFARMFRQRIGCRNRMVWGNKSSESTYRLQNVLEVQCTYTETRARRGCRSVLERKLNDKITIARVIMPVISPFVA